MVINIVAVEDEDGAQNYVDGEVGEPANAS